MASRSAAAQFRTHTTLIFVSAAGGGPNGHREGERGEGGGFDQNKWGLDALAVYSRIEGERETTSLFSIVSRKGTAEEEKD